MITIVYLYDSTFTPMLKLTLKKSSNPNALHIVEYEIDNGFYETIQDVPFSRETSGNGKNSIVLDLPHPTVLSQRYMIEVLLPEKAISESDFFPYRVVTGSKRRAAEKEKQVEQTRQNARKAKCPYCGNVFNSGIYIAGWGLLSDHPPVEFSQQQKKTYVTTLKLILSQNKKNIFNSENTRRKLAVICVLPTEFSSATVRLPLF